MAIVFLQQRKIQKRLIFIFVATIFITAIIIWQGVFKKEVEVLSEKFFLIPKEIKINFEVLKNPYLKDFQPFTEIKSFEETLPAEVKIEEVLGRENPFLPY